MPLLDFCVEGHVTMVYVLSICAHVCAGAHTRMYIQKSEKFVRGPAQSLTAYSPESRSPVEPGAWLLLPVPCPLPHSTGVTNM